MDATKRSMFSAFQLVETFRELHPEMPMQMASVFLLIAMKPGISQRELLNLLDISQASVSRNVIALTHRNRHGEPGLDLVFQRRDLMDSRLSTLHLTAAGQRFIDRLFAASHAAAS